MYITVSGLGLPEETLIRLTDDEGAGSVDEARASLAITSAQAVVDSALALRTATPLAEPSELVRRLTRDIAVYHLHLRLGVVPETARAAYDDAVGMLRDIACGRLDPGLGDTMPGPEFTSKDREFDRDTMEGM